MTENARPVNRNHLAALTGLAVLTILVLISPLGWSYLLPQIGQTFVTAGNATGVAWGWTWGNIIAPASALIGGLFS